MSREEICRQCPICNKELWVCSANLYLNPKTNEVSTNPKEGFIKGCGCYLKNKIANLNKHCPAKKW